VLERMRRVGDGAGQFEKERAAGRIDPEPRAQRVGERFALARGGESSGHAGHHSQERPLRPPSAARLARLAALNA
jgi:hypothetical protein